MDHLKSCLDPGLVEEALDSLPRTLDETYLRILNSIPRNYKHKTTRMLQLLRCAERPLFITELVDATAIETEKEPYFDPTRTMLNIDEISRYCSSLVEVVASKAGKAIQLAHQSVAIFLKPDHLDEHWGQFFTEWAIHASIATVCLCYTIYLDTVDDFAMQPFEQISSRYWMSHAAAVENKNETVRKLILKLFLNQKAAFERWLFRVHLDMEPDPLWCACRHGLISTAAYLLKNGSNPNTLDLEYGGLLDAACSGGHEEIVQMLIRKDADINWSKPSGDALWVACKNGHEGIVRILLHHLHKANITRETSVELYGQAINFACSNENIYQMLLTNTAGLESWTWSDLPFNPLLNAFWKDDDGKIFQVMLSHLQDADIDISTWISFLRNPFVVSCFEENAKIVQKLLDQVQRVDLESRIIIQIYPMALYFAIHKRSKTIVKMLLDYLERVDIEWEEEPYFKWPVHEWTQGRSMDTDTHDMLLQAQYRLRDRCFENSESIQHAESPHQASYKPNTTSVAAVASGFQMVPYTPGQTIRQLRQGKVW